MSNPTDHDTDTTGFDSVLDGGAGEAKALSQEEIDRLLDFGAAPAETPAQ